MLTHTTFTVFTFLLLLIPTSDAVMCSPGYFINPNNTCSACTIGTHCPDGVSRMDCETNTYSDTMHAASCTSCSVNSVGPMRSNSSLNCKCVANFYMHVADKVCRTCPVNSLGPPNSISKLNCHCNSGYFRDVDGNCMICPAGYRCSNNAHSTCVAGSFSAAGASECTECPFGSFEDSVAQESCETCPAGSTVNKEHLATELNAPSHRINTITGSDKLVIMRVPLGASQGNNISKWSFYAEQTPCTVTPMLFTAWVDGRNNNGGFYYTKHHTGTPRTVTEAGAYTFDYFAGQYVPIPPSQNEYEYIHTFFGWAYTGEACIPFDVTAGESYNLVTDHNASVMSYYFPVELPSKAIYSVQITYSWLSTITSTNTTGATSVFQCKCNSGSVQLVDGNCQGFCTAGKYMKSMHDVECTTCEQGYFCLNSMRTECPYGYSSLPGAVSCTPCASATHSNVSQVLCGMRYCPDTVLSHLGPYWEGVGDIAITTSESIGAPNTPWKPGSVICGMALNAFMERPVAYIQRMIPVTANTPVAFQFRMYCSGLKCNEVSLILAYADSGTNITVFTPIYSTNAISTSEWVRVSSGYIRPSTTAITIRITTTLLNLNSKVWIDTVRMVSLGAWTYPSLPSLQLQDSYSLTLKRSGSYNETITDSSILRINSGSFISHPVTSFATYPYSVYIWAKGLSAQSTLNINVPSSTNSVPFNANIGLTTSWQLYQYDNIDSPMSATFTSSGSDPIYVSMPYMTIFEASKTCQQCIGDHWCSGQHIYMCPDHSTTPVGAHGQLQCTCVPGFYGNAIYNGTGYSPCSICPVNYFCQGTNHISVCSGGTKSIAGSSVCVTCDANEICENGQTGICPLHSHSPPGSDNIADCVCDDGFYGESPFCNVCEPGSYCNNGGKHACVVQATTTPGATNWTQCYCDRGWHGLQNSACTFCEAGYWCWTGIRNNCPFDSTSNAGASFNSNCSCEYGFSGPMGGPCTQCSVGSYKNTRGTDDCSLCPVGTFSVTQAATSMATCVNCEVGTYNPTPGQFMCSNCAAGSYRSVTGATTCAPCWAGSYSYAGQSTCNLCSTGTRSLVIAATSPTVCEPCAMGSWSAGNATQCVWCGVCSFWSWPLRTFIFTNALKNIASFSNNYRYRATHFKYGIALTETNVMYLFNPTTGNVTSMQISLPPGSNAFNSITALPSSKYVYVILPPNLVRVDTDLLSWDIVYPASLPQGVFVDQIGLWIAQSDGVKCLNPIDSTQIFFFPIAGGASWVCRSSHYPEFIYVPTPSNGFRRIRISDGTSTTIANMNGVTVCKFTHNAEFLIMSQQSTSQLWAYSMFDTSMTKIMSNAVVSDILVLDNNTLMVTTEGQGVMNVSIDVNDARDCSAGKYSSYTGLQNEGQCEICPSGNLCSGGPNRSSCSPGTYSFRQGLREQGQCLMCAAGYYCPGGPRRVICPAGSLSLLTGLSSVDDCQSCPVNYYCPNSTLSFQCPDNTMSVSHSSDLSDCRCAPGFRCVLTKVVHAEIVLPYTVVTFTPSIQDIFKEALALAAGVPASEVHIIAVSEIQFGTTTTRRLLGATTLKATDEHTVALEIHSSIYNSANSDINTLNVHLKSKGLEPHMGMKVTMHKEVMTTYRVASP